jgi:glycosyltransferase involved in cell wall biosynthesis
MDRNIRIALLGEYPIDTTQIQGGVQAAYTYMVRGLSQVRDLEIHILTFKSSKLPGKDEVQQGPLTIHLLPPFPRFERFHNYRTYQSVIDQKLTQIQPDLVHAQDLAADAYVAFRSGYPTVMTVHGIRSEDRKYITSWNKRVRSLFDSLVIEKYLRKRIRHLIAVSHYATEYYRNLLHPDASVYYIPNAVDERFFNVSSKTNDETVLFAGRVTPLKRVLDLVQAFALVVKRVPYAQLRIAGEVTSERAYVHSIYQLIRQSNLEQHIHLLGLLPESMILQEFANCKILALPSAQESAPMVIAQALAAGKPVVATRVGGVSEMVGEDGRCGFLVDVNDIEQLAEAIIRLLQDAALQTQMGEYGRTFARENYHPESIGRQTAEIYRCILSKEQQANV